MKLGGTLCWLKDCSDLEQLFMSKVNVISYLCVKSLS